MFKTSAPVIRRSSAVALNTTSSCKSGSAKLAKPLPLAPMPRQDCPVQNQRVKDNAPIVSIPSAAPHKEKLNDKDTKRKAAMYKAVAAKHAAALKSAKMSSKSDIEAIDPMKLLEILFPSKTASETEVASTSSTKADCDTTAPIPPPKPIIRRKKAAVNPFRNDMRMGTSGKAATGSGSRTTLKPGGKTDPPSAKVTSGSGKRTPHTDPPRKKYTLTADEEAAQAALRKLKASTTAAAASKQSSTILTNIRPRSIPGMLKSLMAADKDTKSKGTAGKMGAGVRPKRNDYRDDDEIAASTARSAALSKEAKKMLNAVGEKLYDKPVVDKKNLGKIHNTGENTPGMRSMIAAANRNPTPVPVSKRKREGEEAEESSKRARAERIASLDSLFDE